MPVSDAPPGLGDGDGSDSGLDEQEVLSRAVGSWQDRGVESVGYVDRLRSGRRLDDVR